jgi:hypothetical protein
MKNCRDEDKEPPVKCYPYDGRSNTSKRPVFPPNLKIVRGRTNFLNPGNVEDLHKRARDVMPVWLEGVQLNLKKPVSNCVTLKNLWVLSHNTPSGFRLGGTYYAKSVGNVLVSVTFGNLNLGANGFFSAIAVHRSGRESVDAFDQFLLSAPSGGESTTGGQSPNRTYCGRHLPKFRQLHGRVYGQRLDDDSQSSQPSARLGSCNGRSFAKLSSPHLLGLRMSVRVEQRPDADTAASIGGALLQQQVCTGGHAV